ncbi:pulmonary surfactant-associated protein A-like [Anomaloglossus baeobatrachus]
MMATSGKEADFVTSKSICKSLGGQIVTPKSEAENNAVLAFVKKYNRYPYLGVSEEPAPGIHTYLNGTRAVYTRWRNGEPRGKGKENCIEMYIDGRWNNKVCNQKRLIVCEL